MSQKRRFDTMHFNAKKTTYVQWKIKRRPRIAPLSTTQWSAIRGMARTCHRYILYMILDISRMPPELVRIACQYLNFRDIARVSRSIDALKIPAPRTALRKKNNDANLSVALQGFPMYERYTQVPIGSFRTVGTASRERYSDTFVDIMNEWENTCANDDDVCSLDGAPRDIPPVDGWCPECGYEYIPSRVSFAVNWIIPPKMEKHNSMDTEHLIAQSVDVFYRTYPGIVCNFIDTEIGITRHAIMRVLPSRFSLPIDTESFGLRVQFTDVRLNQPLPAFGSYNAARMHQTKITDICPVVSASDKFPDSIPMTTANTTKTLTKASMQY